LENPKSPPLPRLFILLLLDLVCLSLFLSNPKFREHRQQQLTITMRLSPAILAPLTMPAFDRSQVTPGILHIGVGNFHKAHQAYYIDEVMNADPTNPEVLKWGIVGASLFSAKKRAELEPQGWLQTLVARDDLTTKAQVLGSMIDFLPYDDERQVLTDALIDPEIKICSLTVTEGGYFLKDGKFDALDSQIQYDVEHFDIQPRSTFGVITKALKERREQGTKPFTVMCCDNVPHNGDVTRSVVVGFANLVDTDLAKWIDENVAFPNSMVDRITPGTTQEMKDFVKDAYGVDDIMPIFCEPFTEWVLEDKFCNGRPPLEKVDGVTFVDDVGPYENMKIRILNGGHASLCYPSALLGLDYVHDAMKHPVIAPFLDTLEKTEIIPTVPPVKDRDLQEYWGIIGKRFANPTIMDTIPRNCYDGASRQPKFIVPVVADNLKMGNSVSGLALVSAMWCRYCQGKREDGSSIEPNDPQWDRLHALAKKSVKDPALWLGMEDVYGKTGKDPMFLESFSSWVHHIDKQGVSSAMQHYIQTQSHPKGAQELVES